MSRQGPPQCNKSFISSMYVPSIVCRDEEGSLELMGEQGKEMGARLRRKRRQGDKALPLCGTWILFIDGLTDVLVPVRATYVQIFFSKRRSGEPHTKSSLVRKQ
jgi:hypothetical protein